MTQSFFEYLGLADMERIHSQFLAWVLSDDCDAIESNQKHLFFRNLFDIKSQVKKIQTERNNIDIFIQTDNDIVIIENKIKSSQHSNQLGNYKEYCNKEFPKYKKHFFFLTLIDEKTNDKDWKRISYSFIYKKLKELKLKENNSHSYIIKEYLIFLERLDSVLIDFKNNVNKYDIVFLDGHKKKQDKKRDDYKSDNEWFIALNQLETILQKSFLSSLVEDLMYQKGIISETRGSALVDFSIKNDIEISGRKYSTGIQLQGSIIKFFFVITENYKDSKKEWIEKVELSMSKMSKDQKNNFGYNQLNKAKKLTFVSISKKLDEPYWHKLKLKDFVEQEIKNGNELTISLIEHLNIIE